VLSVRQWVPKKKRKKKKSEPKKSKSSVATMLSIFSGKQQGPAFSGLFVFGSRIISDENRPKLRNILGDC